jgi:nucleotide-binding universal stress UspA family protein
MRRLLHVVIDRYIVLRYIHAVALDQERSCAQSERFQTRGCLAPSSSHISMDMVSFRNVLFATDFSSCSEAALPYGIGMCRRYDATLYTVSVVSAEITYDVQPPHPFYLRHTAERKMAKLVTSGVFQGINHRELVKEEYDSVSKVLLELIDRLCIDLIVLGMHGCGGIKQLVLGSVAEEIVNSAPCPVLTVGPQVPPKLSSEFRLGRILCATDLQPGSARVLTYALSLAKDEFAQLTLLHILKISTPTEYREAQRDIAMKQLLQMLPPYTTSLVEGQSIVEFGTPEERIPKTAEDLGADLIVIGPHHTSHPRIAAHLPWAMLHQVLSHARCPVLRV